MFIEIREALKSCLVQCGAKSNIYTSEKRLRVCNESRVFAILSESDGLAKNKTKRIYTDINGKHKRRKRFDRDLTFSIVIGEYSMEKVQEIYDQFLEEIPDGIYVKGNYVEIEPIAADWIDDEDTIIRAKCAVQIKVVCKGGVYKDTDFAKINDIEIAVNRKEAQDGKERDTEPGEGTS